MLKEDCYFSEITEINGLKASTKKLIASCQEIKAFRPGQYIVDDQTNPSFIYKIVEGHCRILTRLNGKLRPIDYLKKDEIIGLASMVSRVPCEIVTAGNEAVLATIPDWVVNKVFTEDTAFRAWCIKRIWRTQLATLAARLAEACIIDPDRVGQQCIDEIGKHSFTCTIKAIRNSTLAEPGYDARYFIASRVRGFGYGSEITSTSAIELTEKESESSLIGIRTETLGLFKQKHQQSLDSLVSQENEKDIQKAPAKPTQSNIYHSDNEKVGKFQVVRCSSKTESLLSCLRMIAEWYGLRFRGDQVERAWQQVLNAESCSLRNAARIIPSIGLIPTMGKVSTENASRIGTPCIIVYDSTFIVVLKGSTSGFVVASPIHGKMELKQQHLTDTYPDGIEVLRLHRPTLGSNKRFSLAWFYPQIKKHRAALVQVLAASFVIQLFSLANPLLIQVVIDKVINQRSLDTLEILGIALVIVTFAEFILSTVRSVLFTDTTNRIDERLGAEIIDHMLRIPLQFFEKRSTGELSSRIGELEKIRSFLTGSGLTSILDAIFSVVYITFMFVYSWILALIALCVVPLQFLISFVGSPLYRRSVRAAAESNAKVQGYLVEALGSIQTIKTQNMESSAGSTWGGYYNKYINKSFSRNLVATFINQSSQLLQKLSQLLVLWVGAYLVLQSELTLGQLIAFRIISGYVTQPLLRLAATWQSFQEIKVSIDRLADVVDTDTESTISSTNNIAMPEIKGGVNIQDLSFRFDIDKPLLLRDINISVSAGSFVGIIGRSGSGKSTLMKLLARLYPVTSGKILIDNVNISKVEIYSLRRQIGYVPQEPILFSGTVLENISLTNPSATTDEVVRASRVACAHEFIMELPEGYSTNVGERGSNLSGGQRQRIALARTILSDPNILILDEATSALDTITESRVCKSLKEFFSEKTVFFVSHRLATVRDADSIMVFDRGRLVESGVHIDLVSERGLYYSMLKQQGNSIQ